MQAFALQADGGQRIFDFMGEAACDFFPSGIALVVLEFGHVFKDDDLSAALFAVLQRQRRTVANQGLARAKAAKGDFRTPAVF